jgi:hypothetical protein
MFGLGQSPTTEQSVDTVIDPSTPFVAAADGDLSLLQTALRQLGNLPVHIQDEHGYTLLQAAVSYNQTHVWTWLATQPGFDVSLTDHDGDTALHYAVGVKAAQFLVETAGLSPQIKNQDGQTALDKKREELQEMQQDEDFEETDPEYQQLLALVQYLGNLSTVAQ